MPRGVHRFARILRWSPQCRRPHSMPRILRLILISAVIAAVMTGGVLVWALQAGSSDFAFVPRAAVPTIGVVTIAGQEPPPKGAGALFFSTVGVRHATVYETWFGVGGGGELMPAHSVLQPGESEADRSRLDTVAMDSSQSAATVVGLRALGVPVTVKSKGVRIVGIDPQAPIATSGAVLGDIIVAACRNEPNGPLLDGDVLVVTQKVVSKAEGQLVAIDPTNPLSHKQLVEDEAVRIVRRRGDLIITETKHGFVCANSGVDLSNVERGQAALLPKDSDRSARRIRDIVRAQLGVEVGVIVSDTFGRAWRKGLTDVAIGVAGIAAVVDLRGTADALGRVMQVTEVAIADELASAAELVMGKSSGIPVAVVRGADPSWFREASVSELVRPPQEDLFR